MIHLAANRIRPLWRYNSKSRSLATTLAAPHSQVEDRQHREYGVWNIKTHASEVALKIVYPLLDSAQIDTTLSYELIMGPYICNFVKKRRKKQSGQSNICGINEFSWILTCHIHKQKRLNDYSYRYIKLHGFNFAMMEEQQNDFCL